MRTRPFRFVPPFAMAALVVGFNACGSRSDGGYVETMELEECRAYEDAVRACMQTLGTASAEAVASLRKSLVAASKDEASRAQLKTACTESAARVRGSCR